MIPGINDPRLKEPQCDDLSPVETLHKNEWFTLRNRGGYYTIEYNHPQITILPIVDQHSIVMVHVTRPIIADTTLELPSGGAVETEIPAEAARRELAEETGIVINDLGRFEALSPLVYSPRSPLLPHYFQVQLSEEEYKLRGKHDQEITKVECINFIDVLEKIKNGQLYIGLQIAVIMRYFLKNRLIVHNKERATK